MPKNNEIEIINGIRIFSLAEALTHSSPRYFSQNPTDARTALSLVRDPSEILNSLLAGGHSTVAGRLVGAFRNINNNRIELTRN